MSVMIGIDPHKGSHTAVVIDCDGVVIDEIRVRASANQVVELREWASDHAARCWAVESARGLGYLLSQQLVASGERVLDVPPMMASRVRLLGSGKSQKNDPNDARSVAIAALRHPGLATVVADDHTRVLGLLAKRHRDVARLKNKAACRLHALLVELTAGGLPSEMTVNKANSLLENIEVTDEVTRQRIMIATELIDDIARFNTQLRASKKRIRIAVAASGTNLCDIRGIGPIGAAIILGAVGDINRFPTKGHFASYNATAPIDASSGNHHRHRLNPRGNRRLNHVLHIAAVCQLRYPSEGRVYFDKKLAEGKTSKEAIRALKRRISDVVYRQLKADARRQTR
ncbi:MAG: IS110 family transposase [Acidimicrobiia bacterium]|nr:IS110 family transposase [Acidimicrobiia bacterium]